MLVPAKTFHLLELWEEGTFGLELQILNTSINECMIKVEIPELYMAVNYDFIVDCIEEDLLIDASMLHYAQIQLQYNTQELSRKSKVAKGVTILRHREYKARRITLQTVKT